MRYVLGISAFRQRFLEQFLNAIVGRASPNYGRRTCRVRIGLAGIGVGVMVGLGLGSGLGPRLGFGLGLGLELGSELGLGSG